MSEPAPTPEATAPSGPEMPKPKSGLANAALIVAIVAVVFAIIPGLSFAAFIPAVTATALGIAAMARKSPDRGKALAALIAGPIALVVSIVVSVALVLVLVAPRHAEAKAVLPVTESGPAPATHEGEPLQPSDDSYLVIVSGTGDTTLPMDTVDGIDLPMAISFTHDGSGAFSATTLDASGGVGEVLVDTVGAYSGTLIANIYRDAPPTSIRIVADGGWSYTVRTIYALPEFTTKSTWGIGDMVLIYSGDATTATFTHDGSGQFSVWTYGDQPTHIIDESGAYSGSTPLRAGPELIAITANGEWTIELK